MIRLSVLLLVLATTGCAWESRPDGGSGVHTPSTTDTETSPLSSIETEAEIIEPLDGAPVPTEAPVDLSQPAPTTGTADNTSEVEEALTPGTEQ